jgi:hypothetical protein
MAKVLTHLLKFIIISSHPTSMKGILLMAEENQHFFAWLNIFFDYHWGMKDCLKSHNLSV